MRNARNPSEKGVYVPKEEESALSLLQCEQCENLVEVEKPSLAMVDGA